MRIVRLMLAGLSVIVLVSMFSLRASAKGVEGYYVFDGDAVLRVEHADRSQLVPQTEESLTISGTIYLPEGSLAPPEGLTLMVFASGSSFYYGQVRIDGDQPSAFFTLNVTPGDYRLQYELHTQSPISYVREGYYSQSGTVFSFGRAEIIEVTDSSVTGKDLFLMAGIEVSGSVSLPSPDTAAERGVHFQVGLWGKTQQAEFGEFNGYVHIAEGEDKANFSIIALPGNYRLHVFVNNSDLVKNYVRSSVYNIETGMTIEWAQASSLQVNAPINGLNIIALRGHEVSGKVFLPEGQQAPPSGMQVGISYRSISGGWQYSVFSLRQGESQLPYSFVLPPGQYHVKYNAYNHTDYVPNGYYHAQGTVAEESAAGIVDITAGPAHDIDLFLIPSQQQGDMKISGTIILPYVTTTPVGLKVSAIDSRTPQSETATGFADIVIPDGNSTGVFSIDNLPAGDYLIKYRVENGDPEIPWDGFYSTSGQYVNNYHSATLVPATADGLPAREINPPRVYRVTGSISIPTALPQGATVSVILAYGKTHATSAASFSVPIMNPVTGSNTYELRVPAGEYYLYYNVTGTSAFKSPGYYSQSEPGTSTDPMLAAHVTVVAPAEGNVGLSGKNLSLLPAGTTVASLGDVNGDGNIDVRDAILIMRHIEELQALTDEQLERADIDGDGVVDRNDAQLLLDFIVGKIAELPSLTPEGQ